MKPDPKNNDMLRAFDTRNRTPEMRPLDEFVRVSIEPLEGGRPITYGWNRTVDDSGRVDFEKFGDAIEARLAEMAERWQEPGPAMVQEDADGIVHITADLPQCSKEDIDIEVTDSGILIRAKSPTGKYREAVTLSAAIDPTTAEAHFAGGQLEVSVERLRGASAPAWRRIHAA